METVIRAFAIAGWVLCAASSATAALQPRDLDPSTTGIEAVYDTARHITWLADPLASGLVTWPEAVAFADSFAVGASSDWRMATGAEMRGLWDDWQQASLAQFPERYWTDPTASADAGMGSHFFTGFPTGLLWDPRLFDGFAMVWQFSHLYTDQGPAPADLPVATAWLVTNGDVAVPAIPEPASVGLLIAGLGVLGLASLSKQRQHAGVRAKRIRVKNQVAGSCARFLVHRASLISAP